LGFYEKLYVKQVRKHPPVMKGKVLEGRGGVLLPKHTKLFPKSLGKDTKKSVTWHDCISFQIRACYSWIQAGTVSNSVKFIDV